MSSMASHLTNGETGWHGRRPEQHTASLEVLTSIRYDLLLIRSPQNTQLCYNDSDVPSQFYMLRYHRDRMLAAVHELGWTQARSFLEGQSGIVRLKQALQDHLNNIAQPLQPLKVIGINLFGVRFVG